MTFNHQYVGSSLTDLSKISGYMLMVNVLSSKQKLWVRVRLAANNGINNIRVSNLMGKEFPCQGRRCRIEADLTR